MADDKSFKELIVQQKKTNKLLQHQIADDDKGSRLGTSIKDSLGEIINDRLIGRLARAEHDQTQEQIVKSAEQRTELDKEHNKENAKVWTKISSTLTGAFVGKQTKTSAAKESFKDERDRDNALLKKYLGSNSWVGKKLLGVFNGIGKLFSGLYGKGKGILGVLLGLTGYGLLLKYLNSDGFKTFIESGDAAKQIADAARNVNNWLQGIINFFDPSDDKTKQQKKDLEDGKLNFFERIGLRIKKLGMDLLAANKGEKDGEEYGFKDAIMENKLTVAGIAIALYARTIATIGAGLLLKGLLKGAGKLAIATRVKRLLFGTAYKAGGVLGYGTSFLRAAGVVGIVLALYDSVKFAFAKETQERIDKGESTWLSAGIGGFVGSFFQLGSDILSMIANATGHPDIAKALDAQDYKKDLDSLTFDIIGLFDDLFSNLFRGFKRFLFGDNEGDLNKDISSIRKRMNKNIELRNAFEKKKNKSSNDLMSMSVLDSIIARDQKSIDKKQMKLDNFDPDKPGGLLVDNMSTMKAHKKAQIEKGGNIGFTSKEEEKRHELQEAEKYIFDNKRLMGGNGFGNNTVLQDNKKIITTHHNGGGAASSILIGNNDSSYRVVAGVNMYGTPGL